MLLTAMSLPELVEGFSPDQRFALVIIGIGCLTAIVISFVGIVAGVYSATKKHEYEMELKRDLVGQGKSAEEIERIINPADGLSRAIAGWTGGKRK